LQRGTTNFDWFPPILADFVVFQPIFSRFSADFDCFPPILADFVAFQPIFSRFSADFQCFGISDVTQREKAWGSK
jgi:hypothetical protein